MDCIVHGVTKSRTRLSDFTFTYHFHALEKEMATHSSVLAWRIPGMGKPGGLLSMGSHRVGYPLKQLSSSSSSSSSVDKESAYNAGDPGSIPGSGRSAGEGIGHPLQYSWASLVVQLVKNPSALQEIWVRSLGWEDPLEKGKATHSTILAWRITWTV